MDTSPGTRNHARNFTILAFTMPGAHEPDVAIAASRAGGTGIIDLEYGVDIQAARGTIQKTSRYARNKFGVKLDSCGDAFIKQLLEELPPRLSFVILTFSDVGQLKQQIDWLHQKGLTVLLESIDLRQAMTGEEAGVDGIIAKGHESGGVVGEETTFILLQRFQGKIGLPVFAQGGIGIHTAAACYTGGAAGIVLDSQLALCRESSLPDSIKRRIAVMDGSEAICFGEQFGARYRIYVRPNLPVIDDLRRIEEQLFKENSPDALKHWRRAIKERAGFESAENNLLLLGQDAPIAATLAEKYGSVGAVIEGIRREIGSHVSAAKRIQPLGEGSILAKSHGTRYPVVQGPMARVSDNPDFALAVAEAGALPFLALSTLDKSGLNPLLAETKRIMGPRPWGVGMIGFLPPALFNEQINTVLEYRPPFALIAGGRPGQNKPLEKAGIPTYIHVPSPGLLDIFIKNGDNRFIFEGRECGGHTPPHSSFPLWETMINGFLRRIGPGTDASGYHILFAGGIHDARSASMVATMSAPLAERGVRVGVLMGTAYLFTRELVRYGGITPVYQEKATGCKGTVVVEVGPGHASRCLDSHFTREFAERKIGLIKSGKSPDEIYTELDRMCIGRLGVAAKGTLRGIELSPDEQYRQGMYMIGQAATLRKQTTTIAELHHDVVVEGSRRLKARDESLNDYSKSETVKPSDIAIIGMACLLPKAPDLKTYWQNIINKVNAITEVPKARWDASLYYDKDPKTKDKVYSKWGGFLDDIIFDPAEFGIPPSALRSIEPLHLLVLETAKKALIDAGYEKRAFNRERTSVIFGAGGGGGDLAHQYGVRAALPHLLQNGAHDLISELEDTLPEWTEDSFPGILMNVAAGRVANRFDLGGANFVVDAACASSMAAVYLAVKELETRTSDMVIAGGSDTMQNVFAYLCFAKTGALSPTGLTRTFDEAADGTVLGEGTGVLVLKRLADAERDGDRIYAVIKGVGFSSDGKARGITAPRLEGQILALKRAYEKAGIQPATVGLIEAHGTGTRVGDAVEIRALSKFLSEAGSTAQSCAIGSVKSMIGHTKNAAGAAGLMKAALSLYVKTLPPTLGVSKPEATLTVPNSPLYVNTRARPWIRAIDGGSRRAGASAFGFGGTNFHAVIEEYADDYRSNEADRGSGFQPWPSELFLFPGESRRDIIDRVKLVKDQLGRGARPGPGDLSFTLSQIYEQKTNGSSDNNRAACLCLSVIATSIDDLREKLGRALAALDSPDGASINDPSGICFTEKPLRNEGKIAFLFPGQSSQYPNMLGDLAMRFPEIRTCFERADAALKSHFEKPLSSYIFPPPTFTREAESAQKIALTGTRVAQPAVGAAGLGMFNLLRELGVRPEFAAGHSYGEYVALAAAGVFPEDVLFAVSEARGRFIIEAAGDDPGTMAAVDADAEIVSEAISGMEGVWLANLNAPEQIVITGTKPGVNAAVGKLKEQGLKARLIPVSCAFHSPVVNRAREPLLKFLSGINLKEPEIVVYSNTTAGPYPAELQAIPNLLAEHLGSPVRFMPEIEAMYRDGARIFVEVGPHNVQTGLVRRILKDRPCLVAASDQPDKPGIIQLQVLLGRLAANGVPIKTGRLFRGRELKQLNLEALESEVKNKIPLSAWLVNGGRAIPIAEKDAPPRSKKKSEFRKTEINAGPPQPAGLVAISLRKPKAEYLPAPRTEQKTVSVNRAALRSIYPPASPDGEDRVIGQFQGLMNRFLDTQKNIMESLLNGVHTAQASPEMAPPPRTIREEPAQSPVFKESGTAVPPEPAAATRKEGARPFEVSGAGDGGDGASVQRFTLRAVPRPFSPVPASLDKDGVLLITDDGKGVAAALSELLRKQDYNVALVKTGKNGGQPSADGVYYSDISMPAEIESLIESARARQGKIAGIIHLAPLGIARSPADLDLDGWREQTRLDVKSLFYLTKYATGDLKESAQKGGACLTAVTGMGGAFASVPVDNTPQEFFPGLGGVAGFIKTAAIELPMVRAKCIDVDLEESPSALAQTIFKEILNDDGQVEVGYRGTERLVLEPSLTPADTTKPADLAIDSSSVVLVTGGARGITALIASELARRYKPHLLLVGRSPLPETEETGDFASLDDGELKTALISRMQKENPYVKPADVEAAYRRRLRDREIRQNMAQIRSYGATVKYFQVDVRKADQFESVIGRIYEEYGNIDGVIHGAGIIEDKLIRDKTPESFDRVFDTKADSAFILAKQLRPDTLKFFTLFSSIVACFGNEGQADYGAANGVYNKLALYLNARWPGRVVSIMWGPWAYASGMVSEEVERKMEGRGVVLVPGEVGVHRFFEELLYGKKDEAEVIIGGSQSPAGMPEKRPGAVKEPQLPFFTGMPDSIKRDDGELTFERELDPRKDFYLNDHRIDGKPVLPMAMALELVSETASFGWPPYRVSTVNDLRVLQGIVLENGAKAVRVVAKPITRTEDNFKVDIGITDPGGPGRVRYRAIIGMAKDFPEPPQPDIPSLAGAGPFPMSMAEMYREWLFHGPVFQRIRQIDAISTGGASAIIRTSAPGELLDSAPGARWLIDPVIVDGGLQLILIWAKFHWDMIPLPTGFTAFKRYQHFSGPGVRVELRILPGTAKPVIHANLAFLSERGELLGVMENIEGVGSTTLNRLAGDK